MSSGYKKANLEEMINDINRTDSCDMTFDEHNGHTVTQIHFILQSYDCDLTVKAKYA